MRSAKQQRAVKMAVSSAVVFLGIAGIGCDRRQADVSAIRLMEKGDYVGAAKEKASTPGVAAVVAARAADQQLAKSVDTYEKLSQTGLAINESLWSLSRISLQASGIHASGALLGSYNPQQSLAALDKTVQQVKGEGQQTWSPTEGIAIPSASAAAASTNQLKDQITESQRNLAALVQKRDAANKDAQRLLDESRAATGENGIALLKQMADARKLATEVQVQIDNAETAQLALKQQLAVAESQGHTASETVETLGSLRADIEKSWRAIATHAESRSAAATGLYGKVGDKSGTLIAQATTVLELFATQDKQLAEYEQELQQASGFAKDAVTNGEKALREAGTSRGGKGPTPASALAAAVDPSMNRFVQAHIDYTLGTAEADQAILLGRRASVAVLVNDAAKSANAKAPEGFDAATIGTWRESALTKANESLKSAAELFLTVSDAPAAIAPVRKAATFGQLSSLHASAMVAPDDATAKGYLDQAKALRDKLMATPEEAIPSLPPSLRGAPAPAAATPAAAPAAAPAGEVEK